MNAKIKTVKNIGSWSLDLFGGHGTVFEVKNGEFNDCDNFTWNNNDKPFTSIDDINSYFGESDIWQTVFELVNEQEGTQ